MRDSLSAGTGAAATGFYATLLSCTQAVADDSANKALNLEHKKFLNRVMEDSETLDPRALWAFKSGDGDKYGGFLEEPSAKKK